MIITIHHWNEYIFHVDFGRCLDLQKIKIHLLKNVAIDKIQVGHFIDKFGELLQTYYVPSSSSE